jgi:hypothetical protein
MSEKDMQARKSIMEARKSIKINEDVAMIT